MKIGTAILLVITVGMVGACVSGKPKQDTYTDSQGKTTIIQSGKEQCVSTCDHDYSRCMDSFGAQNSGVNGPNGMFGGSADCRTSLSSCNLGCKGR